MTLAADPDEEAPHTLLLYRGDEERLATVRSWVQRGLERGEKIVHSTRPDDTALVPTLQQGGVDVTRAVHDGQLALVPLEEFFPGAAQATLARRALADGYPRVRFSLDADAALRRVSQKQYEAIDRLTDQLCATLPVFALCMYDGTKASATTDGTVLAGMVDCHLDAFQDSQMRLHRRGDRVEVAGEVDLDSADVLGHALHRLSPPERGSELVIDLAGLTFVDVVACRALVTGTGQLREAGGRVVLRGVNAHTRKVMSLLGMDRLAGLELA